MTYADLLEFRVKQNLEYSEDQIILLIQWLLEIEIALQSNSKFGYLLTVQQIALSELKTDKLVRFVIKEPSLIFTNQGSIRDINHHEWAYCMP